MHKVLTIKLVLASGSPRRAELLKKAGFSFRIQPVDVDETLSGEMKPTEAALQLAHRKFQHFQFSDPEEIVVTADTIVAAGNFMLAKPADHEDAYQMLSTLSSRVHQVITGVCIGNKKRKHSFYETTQVEFDALTEQEIKYYIETYQPFDKAGAYGIQEWIGMIGISKINGCYYNVMGLPVRQLYRQLKDFI